MLIAFIRGSFNGGGAYLLLFLTHTFCLLVGVRASLVALCYFGLCGVCVVYVCVCVFVCVGVFFVYVSVCLCACLLRCMYVLYVCM